ncbi:MAG: tetratricopeptide repeat protein [Chitinophagaceae bacterium]|jgi:tetratricopeptide (TPR) repeat protein|nr:tetratricopeptide repeat protein [Chitinophagaceae bacterium]
MANFSNRREREEMQELLKAYQNLKKGRQAAFIEEEDFERIIDYFDDQDDVPAALEAANIGLEHFPFAAQLMFRKADFLIAEQQFAAALAVLETAELYDQTDISLYILKTDAYLALDEPEKAARILEESLGRFEGEERLELLFELADVYDDYEDFQKVFDCMKLILEEDPNNEEALLKICFWADFTGRMEESIKLHQWIIDEHPYNELAWFNLATAFQGLKLYEKAIDAYQYAVAIDEKLDIAYRNMADAYIRLRRFKEAIDCLEKVVEMTRPEDVIYEALGHCYHKLENFAQARFYYKKASHISPEDSRIHYKIAITYYRESKFEKAIKQLENAMRLHRSQPDFNLLMGDCMLQLNRLKEAAQYYAVVVQLKPKNVRGQEALVEVLLQAGFYEEAYTQSLHAMESTRQHPLFLYTASAALFGAGKTKEALLQLEQALSVHPQGFKKMVDMVPGLLQIAKVVELANHYLKKKKGKR